jgi:hypothetical protein
MFYMLHKVRRGKRAFQLSSRLFGYLTSITLEANTASFIVTSVESLH